MTSTWSLRHYAAPMGGAKEQVALVALLQTRPEKMTWAQITAEVVEVGSAVAVWERFGPATLLDMPGELSPLATAERSLAAWRAQGHIVLDVLSDEYPSRLRGIHQAPPLIFAQGNLVPGDRAVSVVGSKAASERGLAIAASIAECLVGQGVSVVAGLAAGIDTAAHRAALDAGGRTVAVIGTGINRSYPASNAALHREIAARGLLLSQFWPDAPPQKHNFLMRNATMSGYGLATVVVEAGETSGARSQARMAVEHGRPVILTDLVVDQTDWAKALIGRPGVTVAGGVAEVGDTVSDLTQAQDTVMSTLRNLVYA